MTNKPAAFEKLDSYERSLVRSYKLKNYLGAALILTMIGGVGAALHSIIEEEELASSEDPSAALRQAMKLGVVKKYAEAFEKDPNQIDFADLFNFFKDVERIALFFELDDSSKADEILEKFEENFSKIVDDFGGRGTEKPEDREQLYGDIFEQMNSRVDDDLFPEDETALLSKLLCGECEVDGASEGNCQAFSAYYALLAYGVLEEKVKSSEVEIFFEIVNIRKEGEAKATAHRRTVVYDRGLDKYFVFDIHSFKVIEGKDFDRSVRGLQPLASAYKYFRDGVRVDRDLTSQLRDIDVKNSPFSLPNTGRFEVVAKSGHEKFRDEVAQQLFQIEVCERYPCDDYISEYYSLGKLFAENWEMVESDEEMQVAYEKFEVKVRREVKKFERVLDDDPENTEAIEALMKLKFSINEVFINKLEGDGKREIAEKWLRFGNVVALEKDYGNALWAYSGALDHKEFESEDFYRSALVNSARASFNSQQYWSCIDFYQELSRINREYGFWKVNSHLYAVDDYLFARSVYKLFGRGEDLFLNGEKASKEVIFTWIAERVLDAIQLDESGEKEGINERYYNFYIKLQRELGNSEEAKKYQEILDSYK